MITVAAKDVAESTEEALKYALDAAHATARVGKQLQQIFFSWPNLRNATLRLVSVVSNRYPDVDGQQGSLMANTIVRAVQAFQAARIDQESEYAPAGSYLAALLHASVGIARYDVHGIVKDQSSTRWDPTAASLPTFARDFESIVFVPVDAPDRTIMGAKLILLGKILTITDASFLSADSVTLKPAILTARGDCCLQAAGEWRECSTGSPAEPGRRA